MSKFYPSLFQASNMIESHSWFDIKNRKNEVFNKKKRKRLINYDYTDTLKIVLDLTDTQKEIISRWTDDCIDIYNYVNGYIKTNATNKNCKKFINYYSLRDKLDEVLHKIRSKNKLNKHIYIDIIKKMFCKICENFMDITNNISHEISNKDRLGDVLAELNWLEMQGNDLPPHFGAWCRGLRETNPAYVTFLPNALHKTNGIALNVSTWAMNRAQLADAMLATMGIS